MDTANPANTTNVTDTTNTGDPAAALCSQERLRWAPWGSSEQPAAAASPRKGRCWEAICWRRSEDQGFGEDRYRRRAAVRLRRKTTGRPRARPPRSPRCIFERLGIDEIKPVPVDFGALIPGLNAQQFDVVSAGMYINPDRCAQVLFSDPDYLMLDAFIVRKGNPHGIRTYEDIAKKGLKLASGKAYAEIDYAKAAGVKEHSAPPGPGGRSGRGGPGPRRRLRGHRDHGQVRGEGERPVPRRPRPSSP